MAEALRYDNRVAIVTGAGGGLGRAHAIYFASRGAAVVVNDIGADKAGIGESGEAADATVEMIKRLGGTAIANYDSVERGERIVEATLSAFGPVDILVNNAGILRDASFHKLSIDDWDRVIQVHLSGSFRVTRAAWETMRQRNYGRVVFTSSAAGIYGAFGQSAYAAAKLGLYGLAQSLAIEGQRHGINVNTISPAATTRLTESTLPPGSLQTFRPEYVSPLVGWLCHERCQESGGLFETGAGHHAKLRWQRSNGVFLQSEDFSAGDLAEEWDKIVDFKMADHPTNATAIQPYLKASRARTGDTMQLINVEAALAAEIPMLESKYDERDLALYALSIGMANDPLDTMDLPFVYEEVAGGMKALPTFAAAASMNALAQRVRTGNMISGLNYGAEHVLHGEQYLEVLRDLPARGTLRHSYQVKDIYDKGSNAVVVLSSTTTDEHGHPLIYSEITQVVRGAGGWGGDRGPSTRIEDRKDEPDFALDEVTSPNAALLYRLSGDLNPIHVDPELARVAGLGRPILHGLFLFGVAARLVLKHFCGNKVDCLRSIRARFTDLVYPGEALMCEFWQPDSQTVLISIRAKLRQSVVLKAELRVSESHEWGRS